MRTLKFALRGNDVAAWQSFLQNQGFLDKASPADGIFGQQTLAATVAYQKAHGLVPDGIVGSATLQVAQAQGFKPVEVTDLSALVAIPANINQGLNPAHLDTMLDIFGTPGELTDGCSDISNEKLDENTVTASVGPFEVTGWQPAVDSLRKILAAAQAAEPEVIQQLQTAGMSCVRRVAGSESFSNHSFGTAIDLFFGADVEPQGVPQTQLGIAKLFPFFNQAGWYWGAGFPSVDTMHFEMGDDLIRATANAQNA